LYETFNKIPLNTERLQQAKACFDAGKFREANAILNAEEIASEVELLQDAQRRKKQELDKIDSDLMDKSNEYLIKAQIWATFYSEPDWYDEAKKYFEEAMKTTRTVEVLFGYAMFLQKHNQFLEAMPLYEEALKICRQLAEENPKAYLPYVATTLNNLAILHSNLNEYLQALEEYEEALKIYRQLAEENPKAYLPDVAMTLNNLSIFYQNAIPNKELSLKYAREAIEVLDKCNDTPFVKEQLEKAKWIIEKWDNE
jgi:tetratricopeptide (TPR) repeat protein